MIQKRTVIVLGAGASVHCGFATGIGLLNLLLEEVNGQGNQEGMISSAGTALVHFLDYEWAQIRDFQTAFQGSGLWSIDQFLERRSDLSQLGRELIAAALIPCESAARLFLRQRIADSWYHHLFQRLGPPETFLENKLTVVTFNYDRSLEAFLCTALQNSYRMEPEEACALVNQFPIIHPHGRLGRFGLTTKGADRAYDSQLDATSIQIASADLRIVSDADSEQAFHPAVEALGAAERIFFIGFAYHPALLERLQLGALSKTMWGSTNGMTPREIKALEEQFKPRFQTTDEKHLALEFLRNAPALV